MKSDLLRKPSYTDIILMLSFVLIGGFHEWVSAVISILLLVFVIYKCSVNKKVKLSSNLLLVSLAVIFLFYLLSAFWAVDSGMAFLGAIKFLPPLLFLFAFDQENVNKENTYNVISVTTSFLVIVTSLLSLIPELTSHFTVAGRLAGTFQYPNSFAMLILISELLILKKDKFKVFDYIMLLVLIFGIIYTGSRTVFVLFILSNVVLFFVKGSKKYRIIFLVALLLLFAVVFLLRENYIVQRYLNISIFESTFIGRILYFYDALPLLIKYPFGMGYLGYNYIYPTIQSGLYSTRFVHNDFLQFFLDIGWIPSLLFIFTIIKKIFSRKTDKYVKIIISTLCLHILFDFDLQFISLFLVLVILLKSDNEPKEINPKFNILISITSVILIALNVYMGIHLVFSYFSLNYQAAKMYPYNTENNIAILKTNSNIVEVNNLATDIMHQNEVTYIPYTVKSGYAYATGDFNKLIQYNRKLLELNSFENSHYENYARMLIVGAQKYIEAGDFESAEYCMSEITTLKSSLEKVPLKLSRLGKRIKDQPNANLSDEVLNYIKETEELLSKAK